MRFPFSPKLRLALVWPAIAALLVVVPLFWALGTRLLERSSSYGGAGDKRERPLGAV